MDLQQLSDLWEIQKLKARYFRCMDLRLWDEFRDVFTDDLELYIENTKTPQAQTPRRRRQLRVRALRTTLPIGLRDRAPRARTAGWRTCRPRASNRAGSAISPASVEFTAGARDHPCGHLLSPVLMRKTGHGCFRDRRMALQHDLYLMRMDVQPAGDDHFLDVASDGELPVGGVRAADIASTKPSCVKTKAEHGCRLVIPVAVENFEPGMRHDPGTASPVTFRLLAHAVTFTSRVLVEPDQVET